MSLVIHRPIIRPAEPTIATSSATVSLSYDVSISGVGFILASNVDNPYQRATAQFQKDQFDASAEAGEQTLSLWWVRSQVSFHGGAGLLYFEQSRDDDPGQRIRYFDSKLVDPWTPGVLSRLPDTTVVISSGSAAGGLVGARRGTDSYAVAGFGSTLTAYKIPDVGAPGAITYTWGGSGTIQSVVSDGKSYYAADTTGVYSGPIDNSTGGAKVWNSGTLVTLGWVKQRLMAGIDNKVYELVGGTPPTLPTAKYTHPNTDWRWTAFADSPAGILAAGYSGDESAVYLFALDAQGAAPTLTAGVVAAQLPSGERVHSMTTYAGSVFAMGTSRGVRVGQFDSQGNVSYGPLSYETANPVLSLTGRGDYLYGACTAFDADGESGLVRFSPGTPVDDAGRVAYAPDILCPTAQTGTASDVAVVADRLVYIVNGLGMVLENVGPGTARTGWLKTSRVRYTTIEPKLFKRAQIRGDFPTQVTVYATTPAVDAQKVLDVPASLADPPEFNLPAGATEWMQLRFQFDGVGAHQMRSWSMKALPASERQRMIQVALRVGDNDMDRHQQRSGFRGAGFQKLITLEQLEKAGDVVIFESLLPYSTESRLCVIDQVVFVQDAQPTPISGVSGVATVTLRTVD